MKKPANLVYGVDDQPPAGVTFFNALQHIGLISINLVYPLLIFRAIGTPVETVTSLLAIAMMVLGVATFLQAMRTRYVGSGYLCPATFTASYFSSSLIAAKLGGLPLVFGMTVFAGVLESVLAPLLNRLRAVFPIEISGLVIFMIGWSAGIGALRLLLSNEAAAVNDHEWIVGGLTLAIMVALNVWGKGMVRMLCALIGLLAGYAASALAGQVSPVQLAAVMEASWIGTPSFDHLSWSFDITLVAPFTIACIAASLKAVGTIAVCQRTNDADWVRPDMRSATGGVVADGVSTAIAGLAGAVGTNTSTPAVALAAATGMASRRVAFAIGGLFILLGFFPKLATMLAITPRAVVVAALLFAVSFLLISGLQVIASRLLDARRTLTLGLAFIAGGAVDVFPVVVASVPKALSPIVGSSFVFATVVALSLNLLFRLGVKKTVRLEVEFDSTEPQKIEDFFKRHGAAWGARPDVINRATFGVIQLIDAARGEFWNSGPLRMKASFDEFSLDVDLAYEGEALEFPEERPSNRQIRESDEGARLMAGFMLRKCADRLRSQKKDGRVSLQLHYDH